MESLDRFCSLESLKHTWMVLEVEFQECFGAIGQVPAIKGRIEHLWRYLFMIWDLFRPLGMVCTGVGEASWGREAELVDLGHRGRHGDVFCP